MYEETQRLEWNKNEAEYVRSNHELLQITKTYIYLLQLFVLENVLIIHNTLKRLEFKNFLQQFISKPNNLIITVSIPSLPLVKCNISKLHTWPGYTAGDNEK